MNLELESYTLSAIITDDDIKVEAFAVLEPKHFSYVDDHSKLFDFLKNRPKDTYQMMAKELMEQGLHNAYNTVLNNPILGVFDPKNIIELQREYLKDQYKLAKKNFDGDRAHEYWKRLQDTVAVDASSMYSEETIRSEISDA